MKGGCIPSRNKLKNNKFRWLATDINFKLLHTGCPITHGMSHFWNGKKLDQKIMDWNELLERLLYIYGFSCNLLND